MISVESVLACIGPGERCTRVQIMQRMGKGVSTVQHLLNACVASGTLRCSTQGRCKVWWKPTAAKRLPHQPVGQPRDVLRDYDREIRQFIEVCMATRAPAPPRQVIRYGLGGH
jgi:hypothetical protein